MRRSLPAAGATAIRDTRTGRRTTAVTAPRDRLQHLETVTSGSAGRATLMSAKPTVNSWKKVLSLPSRLGSTVHPFVSTTKIAQ